MRLIADSGSTKTDWDVTDGDGHRLVTTQGINPYHQSVETINGIIKDELMPHLSQVEAGGHKLFFYGAGCTAETSPVLVACLRGFFGDSATVEVSGDMTGAARALCGHEEGIACILGTGANSCYYDGTAVRENVSPLGYILGDEGSGAYIGKRLVGDVLKRQFSSGVCDLFHEETGLDAPAIIDKVYRQPMANRFLGGVARFCSDHRDNEEIHRFLVDCFRQFFIRNVSNYRRPSLPVHFVGSVAWGYRDELTEAAESLGFRVGNVERSPMDGLRTFHA